jgi:hypothetical protein
VIALERACRASWPRRVLAPHTVIGHKKRARVTGTTREKLRVELRQKYEDGASVRQVAKHKGAHAGSFVAFSARRARHSVDVTQADAHDTDSHGP